MKSFKSLLSVCLLALLAITALNFAGVEVDPVVGVSSTVLVLGFAGVLNYVQGDKSITLNALLKEVWVNDIMENLFNGNEFCMHAIDDSSFVVNNKVHLPEAGAVPSVEKNRSSFPATITERTDTEHDYTIDNYTTDPIRIRNFEELQISYNKRANVMDEHIAVLGESLGDNMAFKWAPSADGALVLRTTGAADGTNNMPHVTATGTRRKLTRKDIARAAKKLDKDKMPKQGRFLLLPPEMYYDLFDETEIISVDFMNTKGLPEGVIRKFMGFNILVRNTVNMYTEADPGVLKAVGAAAAATDCLGALAWSQYRVRKAKGSVDVYWNPDRAEHYGGILSAELNFGGKIARSNYEGVVAIAQGYIAP